ncbi:Serine/threonine-protein phosphatase 7 long form homolog [Linum perenne]
MTTLVKRWRPKTNIFHFYHREVTITLEDIHFIIGLRTDGAHVDVGARVSSKLDKQTKVMERFSGKRTAAKDLKGGRLRMGWPRQQFKFV